MCKMKEKTISKRKIKKDFLRRMKQLARQQQTWKKEREPRPSHFSGHKTSENLRKQVENLNGKNGWNKWDSRVLNSEF